MSEFRQAAAHVDDLEARLALLQQSVADNAANVNLEEIFSFILAAIGGDVDVMMEKFRSRCSMVDPVTNQPRFGPKMLAKVQDLLRRYDEVKLAVNEEAPLRVQVEAKISHMTAEEATKKQEQAAQEKKEQEAQRAAELAREQERERLQHEAREHEAKLQREERQRVEEVAVAAQKKREQREKERAEDERQRQLEEEARERLNASISHGKEGLEKAIGMLRDSTGSGALLQQSLQKLLAVVSNICSSPENAAFRHIPKDNANFHADLGQYSGGHQCLLALGFKELQQGDEAQPRAVFVLEEPDLSEDLDAWSNWFDELKEMQSLVESKL
ncbi:Dynein light chain [Phytophthora cinnamomi]|uniref:Dynein light chain n=1 Tax=Phytophthora cinnamomi TaxID=4785 RepID=UPI00355A0036|nr:Dynein light chain [Phytophthora cinnamomi]